MIAPKRLSSWYESMCNERREVDHDSASISAGGATSGTTPAPSHGGKKSEPEGKSGKK